MATNADDFLMHFGVKGMKWGRRKGEVTTSSTRAPASDDAKNASQAKSKAKEHGLASLSNKELQDLVTRTNLESQYARLNPSKITKGKAKVTDVLSTANIGITAYNTFNSPAAKAGFKAAKAAFEVAKK